MRYLPLTTIGILLTSTAFAAEPSALEKLYAAENRVAWCIVPFDSKKRGPEERVAMLQRLGFTRYAYDWRAEHLPTFEKEITLLKAAKIKLQAVWFPAGVGKDGQFILDTLKKQGVSTELWVMLPQPPADATQDKKVVTVAAKLKELAKKAGEYDCKIGVYNHGGWTGEPENMVAVVKACGEKNVGIIYNLHHGHAHMKRLPEALKEMLPYLYCVNLNGMHPDGDGKGNKILILGDMPSDKEVLNTIQKSGYMGPVGILGHTNDDVDDRLTDNLAGLEYILNPKPNAEPAFRTRAITHLNVVLEQNKTGERTFVISNFNEVERKEMQNHQPKDWLSAFRVIVDHGKSTWDEMWKQDCMTGTYAMVGNTLRFQPKYPISPGVPYRVIVQRDFMFIRNAAPTYVTATFIIPKVRTGPATTIESVSPTLGKLPENTLRMYVQFSAPMTKGNYDKWITLTKKDGTKVDTPFLPIAQELWNSDGTRLTILFDPARVKRGLKPREEAGPILEEGKTFTLTIDPKWEDEAGFPLAKGYSHTFEVTAPDDKPVSPEKWKITPPTSNGAVVIDFEKPLDKALVERLIWVVDAEGKKVERKVVARANQSGVLVGEPQNVWKKGKYKLVIDTKLEDLCGNRVGEAFEVDEFKPVTKKVEVKTVEIPFEVK